MTEPLHPVYFARECTPPLHAFHTVPEDGDPCRCGQTAIRIRVEPRER